MHGVNRNEEELKQRWGDFILMIWSIDPLNFCPWRRMRQMRTYNSLVIYYRVATRGKLLRKCMSFCCPNSINSLFTLFYDQAWNTSTLWEILCFRVVLALFVPIITLDWIMFCYMLLPPDCIKRGKLSWGACYFWWGFV